MSIDITPGDMFDHGVNMANGNASEIARALGLEIDWEFFCGSWEAETVQAACLLFLATDQAYSRPTVQNKNVIMCGIDEEYMTRRVTQILEVANIAADHGLKVLYG